jgi:hypothetical protein
MKRFKSPEHAQRFLEVHDILAAHFRPKRHLLSAAQYQAERKNRFETWREIIAARQQCGISFQCGRPPSQHTSGPIRRLLYRNVTVPPPLSIEGTSTGLHSLSAPNSCLMSLRGKDDGAIPFKNNTSEKVESPSVTPAPFSKADKSSIYSTGIVTIVETHLH